MTKLGCLALLAALILGSPAFAWTPDEVSSKRLAQGQPYLEVTPDPAGSSGLVRAGIEIAATPERVWAVMLDCALAKRMVTNLRSCRVLERDPRGRWDVREQISAPPFFPTIRVIIRADYDPPHGYRFRRSGGDLPVLEGEWRLEPLDGGRRTRVLYESRATLPFSAPGTVARLFLRHEVAQALIGLRRESQAQGAGP